MGCTFTKNGPNDSTGKGKNKNKGKNRELEGIMDIPPPAPVDPRLPLNARQKFSIGKSWKGIARAMEPTGINMFIRLFEEHTELIELFTKLRELRTKESQEDSIELKEHATKVMQTLDESIQSLDNLDYFFDYLHQVGSLHLKIPGFKKEYFWATPKMAPPFLSTWRKIYFRALGSGRVHLPWLTFESYCESTS